MAINAYAALEKSQPLVPFMYQPEGMGPFDAEVKISHCGLCHSDINLIDNDWHSSKYPLVPGHEIIGEVVALGSAADPSLMGKRVGIGWQRSSCQHCEYCIRGENNLCMDLQTTTVDHYGGFAETIYIDSRFAFPIPDALSSETAAPLLCAGVTVYAPLYRHNVDHTMHVGVIGIGGLGHLAVQFVNRLGCEVTAFTSSPSKAEEARELGATHVVNNREQSELKQMRYSLDFILSTVSANLNWHEYLKLLRPNGVLCFVGTIAEPITIHPALLMAQQRSITSSTIGGRDVMQKMLDFAARHNIVAWTETLPFDSVNTAIDRLRKNDVRYRFVLER